MTPGLASRFPGTWRISLRNFSSSAGSFSSTGPGKKPSLYDVLNLDPLAGSDDIKREFYKLSKEYHPDVNSDNPEALLKFQQVSEAYATLSDPKLRRLYDRGQLGRLSSIADHDSYAHEYDGQTFVQSRSAFREKYSNLPTDGDFTKMSASYDFREGQKLKRAVRRSQGGRTEEPVSYRRPPANPQSGSGLGRIAFLTSVVLVALYTATR